jgi:hypothetical protein
MAAKIGTGNVLFRVSSDSPSKVFLGSTAVQTVPGKATIDAASVSGSDTAVVLFPGVSDGGSPITSYEFAFDGFPATPDDVNLETLTFIFYFVNYSGQQATARAVNAVGAGAYSDPYGVS